MTATLKMNNPYSKLGLKRRPTYDEIIGLISENETITGKLPNRDATFFKGSPEGSFFDGSDSLEVLKDEQERLLLKQIKTQEEMEQPFTHKECKAYQQHHRR